MRQIPPQPPEDPSSLKTEAFLIELQPSACNHSYGSNSIHFQSIHPRLGPPHFLFQPRTISKSSPLSDSNPTDFSKLATPLSFQPCSTPFLSSKSSKKMQQHRPSKSERFVWKFTIVAPNCGVKQPLMVPHSSDSFQITFVFKQ